MPSGYTCDVQNGKITDFREFALVCARGMGAAIALRDAPWGPIPRVLPHGLSGLNYHDEKIDEITAEILALEAMTDAEILADLTREEQERLEERKNAEKRRLEQLARYEAMLAQVEAWRPPTADHEAFKGFMIEQLKDSIKFDCRPVSPFEEYVTPAHFAKRTAAGWRAFRMDSLRRDLTYHIDELVKGKLDAERRQAWVDALFASLGETPFDEAVQRGELGSLSGLSDDEAAEAMFGRK